MTIGDRIKNRRIQLGLSQDELAKKCGYKSRSSIQKLENSRDLPLKKITLMANALETTEGYLGGWRDDPNEIPYLGDAPEQQADILADLTIKFMRLNSTNQKAVMTMIDSLLQTQ